MEKVILASLLILSFLLAGCLPRGETLVGEGYASLTEEQKKAFWECFKEERNCQSLLKQYDLYRECSLDCFNKVMAATGIAALIHGDGNPEHLDIVFVAENFTEKEIELLEEDINKFVFGDQEKEVLYQELGFLGIVPIKKFVDKINIYYIKESFVSTEIGLDYVNQVFSFVKGLLPEFKSYREGNGKDIVVVLEKTTHWAAGAIIAEGVMSGIITAPNIVAGSGIGWPEGISIQIIAHEFGHAFADLNDEYFWISRYFPEDQLYDEGEEQTGFGSSNCDLHKKPCEMWCEEIDEEEYQQFLEAVNFSRQCYDILENGNEILWYEICPQLNIPEPDAEIIGYGYAPWKTQEEKEQFCTNFTFVMDQWYRFVLCNAGTMFPYTYVNFGSDCQPKHGCYFGCAGAVNVFRSVPYSIMGCGPAGQCSQFYWYGANETTILEYSQAARDHMTEVFKEYS